MLRRRRVSHFDGTVSEKSGRDGETGVALLWLLSGCYADRAAWGQFFIAAHIQTTNRGSRIADRGSKRHIDVMGKITIPSKYVSVSLLEHHDHESFTSLVGN